MTTPVKRPTGRDEISDAVLDAAERLFAAAGPMSVSLRAIAEEAGVNYGLVHRHFGTRDDLLERLLARYADRWAERLGPDTGYDEALDVLLGPTAETGAYLRLLAWRLLADPDKGAEAHRRHATLDRLADLPGGDDPRATAAALALVFGWRLFHPFLTAALHLDGEEAALHEDVRAAAHRLAGGA